MAEDYIKTVWINKSAPYINQDNLNKLEEAVRVNRAELQSTIQNIAGVTGIEKGLQNALPGPELRSEGNIYIATDTGRIYWHSGTVWNLQAILYWSDLQGKPTSFNPDTHAGSHASAGSDPITPGSIGAATDDHGIRSHPDTDATTVLANNQGLVYDSVQALWVPKEVSLAGHNHDATYVNEADHTKAAHDTLGIDAATVREYGVGTSAKDINGTDLNVLRFNGFYMGHRGAGGVTNAPPIGTGEQSWIYITHIEHNSSWSIQTAVDMNNVGRYTRESRDVGGVRTWSAWKSLFGVLQRTRTTAVGVPTGTWITPLLNSAVEKDISGVVTYSTDGNWTVNYDGQYLLWMDGYWDNNDTGERLERFLVTFPGGATSNVGYVRMLASKTSHYSIFGNIYLQTGSIITPFVYQNSGVQLNMLGMRMAVTLVGA